MTTVWILTEEYNEYDQHGEYFLAVFKEKPTIEKLMKFIGDEEEAKHVLAGGGNRRGNEGQWYFLREEPL